MLMLLALVALLSAVVPLADACTLIAVGKKATIDGSTMVAQTNDCIDCDYRLGVVPRKASGPLEKAKVWPARFAYPRYGSSDINKRLYSYCLMG